MNRQQKEKSIHREETRLYKLLEKATTEEEKKSIREALMLLDMECEDTIYSNHWVGDGNDY